MSNYDEIENIHSYHGTREHIGVNVSGIEIQRGGWEYHQANSPEEVAQLTADGWEVSCEYADKVSMRKLFIEADQ